MRDVNSYTGKGETELGQNVPLPAPAEFAGERGH